MNKSAIVLGVLMSWSPVARGAEPVEQVHREQGVRSANVDGGLVYEFDDDVLDGAGSTARGERIKVRKRAFRTTLIRPRASFVPELFQSAEDL